LRTDVEGQAGEGHGFSRAANRRTKARASAPEVRPSYCDSTLKLSLATRTEGYT